MTNTPPQLTRPTPACFKAARTISTSPTFSPVSNPTRRPVSGSTTGTAGQDISRNTRNASPSGIKGATFSAHTSITSRAKCSGPWSASAAINRVRLTIPCIPPASSSTGKSCCVPASK